MLTPSKGKLNEIRTSNIMCVIPEEKIEVKETRAHPLIILAILPYGGEGWRGMGRGKRRTGRKRRRMRLHPEGC
jgi:hypothetical protein